MVSGESGDRLSKRDQVGERAREKNKTRRRDIYVSIVHAKVPEREREREREREKKKEEREIRMDLTDRE